MIFAENILLCIAVPLLIALLFLLIWQAWKYFAAREREQNANQNEVPVRLYWDVYTADEAEAMEAEQQMSEPLTSDIDDDFRTTMDSEKHKTFRCADSAVSAEKDREKG